MKLACLHTIWIAVLLFSSCTAGQKAVDTATGLPLAEGLSRCAFVSVDIPGITLTPARTAAERQLIGEEKELMEDGWLVASADSVPTGPASAIQDRDKRVRLEIGILEFYSNLIQKFKSDGVLGEGEDGRIYRTPVPAVGYDPLELRRALTAAAEVNRARAYLYNHYRKSNPQEAERFKTSFFDRARSGEWIRLAGGRWVRR